MNTVFARGFAAHRDGRLSEAERDYKATLAAKPFHVDALHYLGVLRHQQGQHEEAEALGRIDDAIERFRNALTLSPDLSPAQYNLGNAYSLIGRHEDAVDAFEKALRPNRTIPRGTTSATRFYR